MAKNKDILGNVHITADEAIAISLERYDELIKKEALLDKLMEGKDINVYLHYKVDETEGRCQL